MTDHDEPVGSRQFAGAQRDVERLMEAGATSWSIVNAVWQRFQAATAVKEGPAAERSREKRLAVLAEELCHAYHYGVGLTELEQEDPQQAAAHRAAAEALLRHIERAPKEDRRAAFRRGYDRGQQNERNRTIEYVQHLEDTVADLRTDRDPEGLRARIADLQYVTRGYGRLVSGRSGLEAELADALARLEAAQRELAVLKGVQPSTATGERPS